jgi:6-phosphogluconate dehydrogenase
VVFDPNPDALEAMAHKGAAVAENREDLVAKLDGNCIIWLMIPSDFVGAEVTSLLEILRPGSLIIDGGNSNFNLTIQRSEEAKLKGVNFLDVGTSGGIMGLENGFSMMVGGDVSSVESIQPILEVLSQPSGGYCHFGKTGSGHFIKMVHNGIEYGMMQAYAEGYRLIHDNLSFQNVNLESVAEVWQKGSIVQSGLNRLIQQIYSNNPQLDGIDGYVADSGEGRWTLELAEKLGVEMPVLEKSIDVRTRSQNGTTNYSTKLLAAMRNAFGGHAINK